MSTISFRRGSADDTTVVFDCLKALAADEGHPTSFMLTEARLRDILSCQPSGMDILICDNDHQLIGLAMWSERFSAYSGGFIMWLHDFYVVPTFRRQRIGQSIFSELRRVARMQGYKRIEWYVHTNNDGAKRFYNKIGAVKADHIENWRLEDL
jgi:GNAT superfamily N-acetyltransferase